jgi:hypothetical protein
LIPNQSDNKEENMTTIQITHILPTGTCFGVTQDKPQDKPVESVFIPGTVARDLGLVVGQAVEALLVPNSHQPERTPWLAAKIDLVPPAASTPTTPPAAELSIADRVHEVMRDGGVWTVATMFEELFPGADKSAGIKDYNAISTALRSMFARNHCAKFQLWRSPDQSKPGREWFTCYPEKADVAEWAED